MIARDEQLPLHVAADRRLDARQERGRPRRRRKAPVERRVQTVEVEQHVDRDDEHEHEAEEEREDAERRALGPVDRRPRRALDVEVPEERAALLLDLDPPEAVVVEPDLEAVDVPLGGGVPGLSVLVRNVGVDPVRRVLGLLDDDGRQGHHRDDKPGGKGQVHDRDPEAARDSGPRERPHERVQEQRHERRDEEEEDGVTDRAGDRPGEQEQRAGAPTSWIQRGIWIGAGWRLPPTTGGGVSAMGAMLQRAPADPQGRSGTGLSPRTATSRSTVTISGRKSPPLRACVCYKVRPWRSPCGSPGVR